MAGGASGFQRTVAAGIRPVASEVLPILRGCVAIDQLLTRRAAIDILIREVNEALLTETAF